jgi:hypothetical protein
MQQLLRFSIRFAVSIFPTFILAIWAIDTSRAGDFNEKTMVTFAAPVEIPGQALPAGTYILKLIDSSTTNRIVQVFDQHERHLFATFLTVPDYRMRPADQTVVLFEERPSDTPEAIKALFCRGDQYARLFVYPHEAALAIARRTHQKVLQMRDDHKVGGIDESGQPIDLKDVVPPKPK